MAFQIEPALSEAPRQTDFRERFRGAREGAQSGPKTLRVRATARPCRVLSPASRSGPSRTRCPSTWAEEDPDTARKASASLGPSPAGAESSLSFLGFSLSPCLLQRGFKTRRPKSGFQSGLFNRVFLSHRFPTYLAEKTQMH